MLRISKKKKRKRTSVPLNWSEQIKSKDRLIILGGETREQKTAENLHHTTKTPKESNTALRDEEGKF